MKAKAYQTDSVEGLLQWVVDAHSEEFKPTLAILFIGLAHDATEVGKVFSDNDIQLFGGNSWGEFVDGKIVSGTIAVLLLDLAEEVFYLRIDDFEGGDEERVTATVANEALERFDFP